MTGTRDRRDAGATSTLSTSTPTTRPCWSGATTAHLVEYVLHALASSLTAGIANIAAARGITLTEVTSTVSGDIDLNGILGLNPNVRNGYQGIKVKSTIKGNAPAEKLKAIVEQSRARSAVFDVITNSVPNTIDVATD